MKHLLKEVFKAGNESAVKPRKLEKDIFVRFDKFYKGLDKKVRKIENGIILKARKEQSDDIFKLAEKNAELEKNNTNLFVDINNKAELLESAEQALVNMKSDRDQIIKGLADKQGKLDIVAGNLTKQINDNYNLEARNRKSVKGNRLLVFLLILSVMGYIPFIFI